MEMSSNYYLIKKAKDTYPQHYSTLKRFHYLKELPQHSAFTVIGYFSIIESPITHAPELAQPMDSLTHQMKLR